MTVFYTTFGSEEDAVPILRELIEDKLLACANIMDTRSLYRWEGDVVDEKEVFVLCKTDEAVKDDCIEALKEQHPYDVPAIVEIDADTSDAYGSWVSDVTRG